MILKGQAIIIRAAGTGDIPAIINYYDKLSEQSRRRFAPHAFDANGLRLVFDQPQQFSAFVAIHQPTDTIIAYTVVMRTVFDYDVERWKGYGILLEAGKTATLAPSVADEWQSRGLGQAVLDFAIADLKVVGVESIILWGGVQCSNARAVNFYLRNGFRLTGYFEYQGPNYDMRKLT